MISMATKPEYVNAGYWWTEGSLSASDINTDYFTHLFAAFADLDGETSKVIIPSSKSDKISTFSSTVKQKAPHIKALLSIGGAAAEPETFAKMAGQDTNRRAFIQSSISLAREHHYDGLDLHWLYPSKDSELQNLGYLLREWQDAVKCEAQESGNPQLLLVATVYYSPYPHSLLYPVDEMTTCLDWINAVASDFYTPQSSKAKTGPTAVFSDSFSSCGQYGLDQWIKKQFPSKSIVLVLPFYGWAWNLKNSSKHEIFSPAIGPATGQEGVSPDGLVDYRSITNLMSKFAAKEVYSEQYITSYCYYDKIWIGYDNEKCVSAKISKAKDLDLLGYVAWHVGGDTEDGILATTAWQHWKNLNSA